MFSSSFIGFLLFSSGFPGFCVSFLAVLEDFYHVSWIL